jgi:acyl-coenzyme A thioesterase PaaI-like protein
VVRLGGRVGSVQMRLVNDEEVLVATGAASYMLS